MWWCIMAMMTAAPSRSLTTLLYFSALAPNQRRRGALKGVAPTFSNYGAIDYFKLEWWHLRETLPLFFHYPPPIKILIMKLKKTPLLVGKTPLQQRLIDRDAEIAKEFWLMQAKKDKYIGEKLAEKYGYVQKNAIYMAVARHTERERMRKTKQL